MSDYICPICGAFYKDEEKRIHPTRRAFCKENNSSDEDFVDLYCCNFDFRFYIHKNIYYEQDTILKEKLLNLTTEHLIHKNSYEIKGGKRLWHFYFNDLNDGVYGRYPEYINLANQIKNYPTQAIEVALRSLVNYSLKYPHYGDVISPSWTEKRLSFEHEGNNSHSCGAMKLLEDLGYVKDPDKDECYIITASGWKKIDELQKEELIINQGFIAMSFKEETKPIREAFRKAMTESGYSVAIIDEKEHNNQIVPEIFYEIERSKFVVVDITYPNYGAYYEAGYAQALGKQVIICCRETEFKSDNSRPHFDISQKSMVVWKDESNLVARLKRRIEATVK